jgi:hypothetical protein
MDEKKIDLILKLDSKMYIGLEAIHNLPDTSGNFTSMS